MQSRPTVITGDRWPLVAKVRSYERACLCARTPSVCSTCSESVLFGDMERAEADAKAPPSSSMDAEGVRAEIAESGNGGRVTARRGACELRLSELPEEISRTCIARICTSRSSALHRRRPTRPHRRSSQFARWRQVYQTETVQPR